MKISEVKRSAREALAGKWSKGVFILLAYLLIEFVIGIISGICGNVPVLSLLLSLAQIIISVPISLGLTFAFIKLKRHEDVAAFDFISLGFNNFSRAWKIFGRTLLKLILPIIAVWACFVVYGLLVGYSAIQIVEGEMIGNIGWQLFLGVVLYIAAVIYLTSVELKYVLSTFVAYDNKDMTALEAVNESARLMTGNRIKAFLLGLSFIGWAFLCAFTLGIGFLWLIPYIQVAHVCFYDYLLGRKEESKEESNAEAITEM